VLGRGLWSTRGGGHDSTDYKFESDDGVEREPGAEYGHDCFHERTLAPLRL
jgi:hypothetical protein